MDGACFHGDESVARVLITLLRRDQVLGTANHAHLTLWFNAFAEYRYGRI
jgi:hypothetical protein